MAKHVKFGGSTAARTMNCPAWLQLAEGMPQGRVEGSNPAADEGTLLHNCMEAHVMHGESFEDMLDCGVRYKDQVLTKALIVNKLTPACEALESLESVYDITEFDCEPFVAMPHSDEIGGSIDYIGISKDRKTVVIADYKFGYTPVEVRENEQLLFYAMCAQADPTTADLFDQCDQIVIAIIQPTEDPERAVMNTQTIPLPALDAFRDKYLSSVKMSDMSVPPRSAGDHCRYCPALTVCPEKNGAALAALRLSPTNLDTLAEAMRMVGELEQWVKAVKTQAHEQLELGQAVDGFKLVHKRATRVWNDTEAVEDKIRKAKKIKLEDGFDVKLKSPAQLEKKCKELGVDFKQYTKYISAVSSGTTLVPESDKRPAVIPVQGLEELNKLNQD